MALTNIDLAVAATEALADAREKNFNPALMSTGFDGYKKQGDVIKVDVLAESAGAAIYNSSTNNYAKDRALTEAMKSVTLGTPILDGFSMSPTEFKAVSSDGLKKRMQRHVTALVKKCLEDGMGLVTSTNFGTAEIIGADTAMDTGVVSDIRKNAKFQKFGLEGDSNCIIGSAYYETLMEQPSTLNSNQRGSREVNVGGYLVDAYRGINWSSNNFIPANAESLVGFVTDGSGLALGMGVSDDYDQVDEMFGPKNYFTDVITDTETGLAVRMTIGQNRDTKRIDVVFDMTYGWAVGQDSKLLRLTSA
jgi:hypothetical protein